MLVAGRYGFHRDELYFIEGGHHLGWAQPDNPILVPLLAAGWHDLVGGQLWAFRIVPALAAGCYVLIAALTARALGGHTRHQIAAAAGVALTGLVLAAGHLFSTLIFDMTVCAAAILLLIRCLGDDRWRNWIALGLVAGIAMEIKVMALPILACCLIGLAVIGPRRPLAGPRLWTAAAIALVLAAPNLIWQARHGWPMRSIAANIAGGGSTSSADRASLIFLHLLMVGPIISVVMIVGVVALLRRPLRQDHGWLAVGYLLFLILVLLFGGKPYYPAAFVPALIAAGAITALDWIRRRAWRRIVALALVGISALTTPLITLPIGAVGGPLFAVGVAVNPDSAETVGWDDHVATVGGVAAALPTADSAAAVIITSNYGEAGALSRARRAGSDHQLPPVYSGHNGFWFWGAPPASTRTAIMVGDFDAAELAGWFDHCRVAERLTAPSGVDNEERGAPVRVCRGPTRPWSQLWPAMAHLS